MKMNEIICPYCKKHSGGMKHKAFRNNHGLRIHMTKRHIQEIKKAARMMI